MRRSAWTLLKLAISMAIVFFIVTRLDIAALRASAASIGASTLLLAVLISLFQNILCVLRWAWIQRPLSGRIALWPAWQVYYASMCLGQCLPSFVGGDAYRIYWLYQEGHPLSAALRAVIIDRVSAVVALVLMLAVGLPWWVSRSGDAAALSAIATLLAGGIGGVLVLFSGDLLPRRWREWRPLAELAALAVTARVILLRGSLALRVNALSVMVHCLSALVMYLLAADMGLSLYYLDWVVLVPVLTLMSALPISIAGWGVREGVAVAVLSLLGVRAEQALVLSLLMGCLALLQGLIGAIPLAFGKVRLSALRQAKLGVGREAA